MGHTLILGSPNKARCLNDAACLGLPEHQAETPITLNKRSCIMHVLIQTHGALMKVMDASGSHLEDVASLWLRPFACRIAREAPSRPLPHQHPPH